MGIRGGEGVRPPYNSRGDHLRSCADNVDNDDDGEIDGGDPDCIHPRTGGWDWRLCAREAAGASTCTDYP